MLNEVIAEALEMLWIMLCVIGFMILTIITFHVIDWWRERGNG